MASTISSAKVQKHQLIDTVRKALLNCSDTFEQAANGAGGAALWGADRMPESWILVAVMKEISRLGIGAFPEARARHDFEYCESAGAAWALPKELTEAGAKIDLLAGESGNPGKIRVRAAIELKGPKSAWPGFANDLRRLRALQPCFQDADQVRIFGYVSPPMSNEGIAAEISRFMKETGLRRDQFEMSKSDTPSLGGTGFSYVFLHTM